mgnify:CR=1 FL=1
MIGTRGKSKGFTLIELIVVMTVFLLVIGTAIGIFISIIQHQKRILSEQELLNQTSYVVEYMSKALRMAKTAVDDNCISSGYIYLLTQPKSGFYTSIKFLNQSDTNALGNPVCQEFYLDDTALKEKKDWIPLGGIPLTSEKLHINSIKFGINGGNGCYGAFPCVNGASENDNPPQQPRVTIILDIQAEAGQPAIKIQTTVSQRNLNAQ